MEFLAAFLALVFFAFAQAPGPDRNNSPDAETRLLIEQIAADRQRERGALLPANP